MANYVKLVGVLAVLALGGLVGYRLADYNHQRFLVNLEKAHLRDLERNRVIDNRVTKEYITIEKIIEVKTKPIIKEIIREIEKPVYRECLLTDNGRVLLDDLIAATNTAVNTGGELPTNTTIKEESRDNG